MLVWIQCYWRRPLHPHSVIYADVLEDNPFKAPNDVTVWATTRKIQLYDIIPYCEAYSDLFVSQHHSAKTYCRVTIFSFFFCRTLISFLCGRRAHARQPSLPPLEAWSAMTLSIEYRICPHPHYQHYHENHISSPTTAFPRFITALIYLAVSTQFLTVINLGPDQCLSEHGLHD